MGVKLGTDLARPAAALSPFAALLVLAAGRPVFTASYYLVDGGSGKVRSFVDQNDNTHVLDQATSANQVAVPAPHADFSGQLCADFTGAEYYDSNRAASAWVPQRDGVSAEQYIVCTPLTAVGKTLCSTIHPTLNNNGFRFSHSSGSTSVAVQVAVYSGGAAVFNDAGTVTVVVGAPTYFGCQILSNTATRWLKGSSGSLSVTPPFSSTGGAPFRLGAATNGAQAAVMRWRECFFFPSLDAAGRQSYQQYVAQTYGVAA